MKEGSRLQFGGRVSWLGNSVAFWVLSSVTTLHPCVLATTTEIFVLFSLCLLTKMLCSLSQPAGICVSKEHWLEKIKGILFIQSLMILFIDELV